MNSNEKKNQTKTNKQDCNIQLFHLGIHIFMDKQDIDSLESNILELSHSKCLKWQNGWRIFWFTGN